MATVCTRLFNLVRADVACFGEKDFQQLMMIRRMVTDLAIPTRILPGALVRNCDLKFICRELPIRVETTNSPFTRRAKQGQILRIPIAHGEGCYIADDHTLDALEAEDRVAFRYMDNANGSLRSIAGVLNEGRNVLGMMPHPERATNALMGSTDGLVIFESMLDALAVRI